MTNPCPARAGHTGARSVLPFACLLAALHASACLETRHSLGGDCLKDGDCISGICTQLRCTASPPTTDSPVTLPSLAADAGTDGPGDHPDADASEETTDEAAPESSTDVVTDAELTPD